MHIFLSSLFDDATPGLITFFRENSRFFSYAIHKAVRVSDLNRVSCPRGIWTSQIAHPSGCEGKTLNSKVEIKKSKLRNPLIVRYDVVPLTEESKKAKLRSKKCGSQGANGASGASDMAGSAAR